MDMFPSGGAINVGGLVRVLSPAQARAIQEPPKAEQTTPEESSLAGHVRKCWTAARNAKQMNVEQRLLEAVRRRRGEYEPKKLADIRATGGSEIYMMLTSNKCRAATAWLRDTYNGTGQEKAWSLSPTPSPDLPPDMIDAAMAEAQETAKQYILATGQQPTPQGMRELLIKIRDRMMADLYTEAKAATERMEREVEDQLEEGGFREAFAAFLDDLATFPTAILKGPVVRRKSKLAWVQDMTGNWSATVQSELVREWERVSPFNFYPSPYSTCIEDGYTIEIIPLSRRGLTELIGVEGYSEEAIRKVLDEYGTGGLRDWLSAESIKLYAEGRTDPAGTGVGDGDPRIDAIQFFGNVSGKMLRDWGMSEGTIPDIHKEYDVEIWLIGSHVIRAVLNPDPLARKPYYASSYEKIPGLFWGNSVVDLIADCQDACNGAARALMNNMGIASGPQVVVNTQRLPANAQITSMYPWKVWQVESDPFGSTAPAIDFFQPNTNANELMAVYEKFSIMADEFSGLPRYMTGDGTVGGAGRTASGMNMLMNNAGKTIRQVIANIDTDVIEPALRRQYYLNMLDPDIDPMIKRGDLRVVASGTRALITKELLQTRRNEYLNIALNSPIAQQVLGLEGAAALLREGAKALDMPAGLVPPDEVLQQRWAAQQQQQAEQMAAQQAQKAQPAQPQADPIALEAMRLENALKVESVRSEREIERERLRQDAEMQREMRRLMVEERIAKMKADTEAKAKVAEAQARVMEREEPEEREEREAPAPAAPQSLTVNVVMPKPGSKTIELTRPDGSRVTGSMTEEA